MQLLPNWIGGAEVDRSDPHTGGGLKWIEVDRCEIIGGHGYHKYAVKIGNWVLVRFPSEETGHQRKLSRPWHGPYRVTSSNATNITATMVYFP